MGNGVETANISDYHMMELHIQPYLLYRRREQLFSSCLSTQLITDTFLAGSVLQLPKFYRNSKEWNRKHDAVLYP